MENTSNPHQRLLERANLYVVGSLAKRSLQSQPNFAEIVAKMASIGENLYAEPLVELEARVAQAKAIIGMPELQKYGAAIKQIRSRIELWERGA